MCREPHISYHIGVSIACWVHCPIVLRSRIHCLCLTNLSLTNPSLNFHHLIFLTDLSHIGPSLFFDAVMEQWKGKFIEWSKTHHITYLLQWTSLHYCLLLTVTCCWCYSLVISSGYIDSIASISLFCSSLHSSGVMLQLMNTWLPITFVVWLSTMINDVIYFEN